ncbi:MAG: hypothetical protein U9N40_07995 [Euryarchaeota archaeon]|nr:hypothetical protein [Euryarchaeota archaeon]
MKFNREPVRSGQNYQDEILKISAGYPDQGENPPLQEAGCCELPLS